MEKMIVGAGVVSIWIRHARSLKDRRQITQSLIQKLKNEGFSATEMSSGDTHKRATIGFSICSGGAGFVAEQLGRIQRLFVGDFEVVHSKTEMLELDTDFKADDLPYLNEPE